jgi:flagellar biosynthetic protein FliR
MFSFTEAQLLQWLTPLLWPFIRTLALFAGLPIFSQRSVPMRVRVGLALFISLCAQPSLPAMPVVPLDSTPLLFMLLVQQLLIGLSMGFAVRLVFAAL